MTILLYCCTSIGFCVCDSRFNSYSSTRCPKGGVQHPTTSSSHVLVVEDYTNDTSMYMDQTIVVCLTLIEYIDPRLERGTRTYLRSIIQAVPFIPERFRVRRSQIEGGRLGWWANKKKKNDPTLWCIYSDDGLSLPSTQIRQGVLTGALVYVRIKFSQPHSARFS